MKAVCVHRHGGPEVLSLESVDLPPPGPDEIRIRNEAIGVNFTDIYFRTAQYAPPTLPFIPGNEGAGIVLAVGEAVRDIKPGDRVGYVSLLGAYAEEHNVPARFVVPLPDAIDFEAGAAMMLKGLTAQYLLHQTVRVRPGDTILVHAAAGGVGLLLVQWAKHLGATVIATAGAVQKAEAVRAAGGDHIILYRKEDFISRVNAITGGRGVDIAYDSVGRDTFLGSLASLRPRGHLVSYGTASGPIEPLDVAALARQGSISVTSPVLFDYLQSRNDILAMSEGLFNAVLSGVVRVPVPTRYPLSHAAEAHTRLEARATTGPSVLIP
ncbi:MAG: quinone oxidoreductase [Pseudomonadota bacterium]|nr:quinone oxidoreductase [Pseudomonadota bacterium]